MKRSEWKVTYNGDYYEVYRIRDISRVDHSGNREYVNMTFERKDLAQAYAAEANDMEARQEVQG